MRARSPDHQPVATGAREADARAGVTGAGRAGRYGIDAPYAPLGQIVVGVVCIAWAGLGAASNPLLGGPLWLGLWGVLWLATAACYLHTTWRGKFLVWAGLTRALDLGGAERVLDLGCGRGLVLLAVAKRLTSGTAVGLDLWRSRDQSGNDPAMTWANAGAEGVADRVELETGDMTALPFDAATFDLVVSALAIHNLRTKAERLAAIDEAVRVTRHGGRLLLADLRHTQDYAERLRALGLQQVARRSLGWRYWYGGPFWATYLVSARKA